jgi:hypothetical protein
VGAKAGFAGDGKQDALIGGVAEERFCVTRGPGRAFAASVASGAGHEFCA